MDIEMEEVAMVLTSLRLSLVPSSLHDGIARYITPVFIKKQENGTFKAALNEDGMPRLKISHLTNALRQADCRRPRSMTGVN